MLHWPFGGFWETITQSELYKYQQSINHLYMDFVQLLGIQKG